MQKLTASVTTLQPKLIAIYQQNLHTTQKGISDLYFDNNSDASTIDILEQIICEHDYYQTCGRW